MNKNAKFLNLIFASESKKKSNNNINNQDFIKKLSSTKQRISDINFSDIGIKNNSNFIGFSSFKTKKEKAQKSNNNSKIKQNKKNLITSLNDTDEKDDNLNNEIILKYQYYKYLSNHNNSKEKNNLKKKYIYSTKSKNNNSNIKTNEIINNNKSNEFEKKKIIINRKTGVKGEHNEKNNRYKKINSNAENKIELFLSSQIKNNVISKEDLISLFNNNKSIKNKNTNNKNITNYTSTNPNNNKKEKNYIASFSKNFEKSCPKFNFNKYSSFRQGQSNINIKKLNYGEIIEDNDGIDQEDKINSLKRVRGNIISNYTLMEQNNYTNNKKNSNLDNSKKTLIKSSKKNDYNQYIIEFFLPNKIKPNLNNKKEYKPGSLQKIIARNNDKDVSNQKLNTQTNINNKNENKNRTKVIGVKKIRTQYEKNNNKKDLTLNNMALKKKRPRYFDSEINSNIIDSTNILKNLKNKNTYLNIIRKAFNNKNNTNYYNNYMSNNNYENKSQRDSKSVNILRNRSNNNINNDKSNRKKKYVNEHYINKLIIINDNKENKRNYSLNKNEGIYIRNNIFENDNLENQEINKDKIIENISNNSLNTYSIFISHKYYKDINNIALKKIKLFDINDNEIPVIFYRTNADFNNGRLFNKTMTFLESNKKSNFREEIINNNIPFVTEIKKDIYIYFYLNNNQSESIKYIQIENYSNKTNKNICPVKNIEIYKAQNLIYRGLLVNNINTIEMNINQKSNKAVINKERPLSSSKTRKDAIIKNSVVTKPEFSTYSKSKANSKEIYYSARTNLFNKFNENANIKEEEEYNEDNVNIFQNSEIIDKQDDNDDNNINDNNTINIHINNNTNNITNLEIVDKKLRPEKKNTNNSYFFTMQNSEKMINNEINLIKSVNQNLDMSFGRINSENSGIQNEGETKINGKTFTGNNNIIPQEIKEFDFYERNDINSNTYNGNIPFNSNSYNYNNTSSYNSNINNNNYIQFNKIKFVFTSNYGHKKHVGLTGIEFYNMKGDLINIESAISIGALPKDLRTIYDDDDDMRIFENVFNGFNNTDEIENMWVTKLKKSEPKSFIELFFKEKIKVSKFKIYNYNEKNNLEICARTIDLYLDDNFYNTIYLKSGIGEIAYDYINFNSNEDKNNDSLDDYNNKENDFGQVITFPIQNSEQENNRINVINNDKSEIKYASFLYEQNYETPFMPCGNYIKFQFLSNYYKGVPIKSEEFLFKYKDVGLDSIEIYNEENIDIISKRSEHKYKIISNCEIFHNKKNKLILNGAQNKNGNNCLFYIFEIPIRISYIKLNPLSKNMKSLLNSVKEIKIFCDNNIIFEGDLYIEHPTIVLFTCDMKITRGINEKYLTKKINEREIEEIKNNKYFSLVLK